MNSLIKHLLTSRAFLGMLVAVAAEALKSYGVSLDQAGLTDDLVSAIAVAVSLSGHLQIHNQLKDK